MIASSVRAVYSVQLELLKGPKHATAYGPIGNRIEAHELIGSGGLRDIDRRLHDVPAVLVHVEKQT